MYNIQWNDRRTDDVRSQIYFFLGMEGGRRRLWGFCEGDDPPTRLFFFVMGTRAGTPMSLV